jgi:hypothetical protein
LRERVLEAVQVLDKDHLPRRLRRAQLEAALEGRRLRVNHHRRDKDIDAGPLPRPALRSRKRNRRIRVWPCSGICMDSQGGLLWLALGRRCTPLCWHWVCR